MPAAFEFRFDALSAEDLSALRELADTVWDVSREVVRVWSRRPRD